MALSDPTETPLPIDYTNSSQGPRASTNDALGNLFKTAAGVADAGIKEADRQKRSDITDDILTQTENIQEEFGVSSATDTEVDAEGTGEAARPPALERAYGNLDTLQNAYEKGALKESHYWARLNVMVRQLRAKYPGYRQDIDTMVAGVVGAKPANALRSALFQEWDEAARAKADNPLSKLEDWAVKDGTLPPDYFQRKQDGDAYSLTELQSYVADKTRVKSETAARQAELSMKINENTIDKADMENSYRVDATQFVTTLLNDSSKVIGKNYADVSGKLRAAQQQLASGMPVNTVELQQLSGQLGQVRMEAEAALQQQFLQSWDGDPKHAYAGYIDKETQQAIISQALAPIDLLMTSLNGTNNPYAVMGSTTAFLEAKKNETQRRLMENVPVLENLGALTQAAGPDATAFVLSTNPDVQNALTKSLLDFSATNGALGQGSIADALAKGEEAGQKADYYNELTKTWQQISTAIDTGEVPLPVIQNQVQYMFGQDSTALLAKMDPASRVMWYTKVASPEVTQRMMKLRDMGDPDSWNTYQDWVKGAFVNIFAQEMNQLNSTNEILSNNMGLVQGSILWDPDTSSFKSDVHVLGSGGALTWLAQNMPGAVWNTEMKNLNAAIQVIKPIIDDGEGDIQKELAILMASMGYEGAQGVQGAMFEQLMMHSEIQDNPNDGGDQ